MPRTPRPTPTLLDRALVLAVAEAERDGAEWLDGGAPEHPGPASDDEALVLRARRIASERGLDDGVRRALDGQRLLWLAAGLVGLLAGASAAWAGLAGGGDPTRPEGADLNVLWFLQATLGVHTFFLLVSLAALAAALAGARHPLVGPARSVAAAIGRSVRARGAGSGTPAAAAAAAAAFGGRRGALLAGALGHTAGLGFVAGAVLSLLVAASFREQYRFFWKSTLLSDGQAAALIGAVAAGPRAVGLPVPGGEQIRAARAGGEGPSEPEETARWAWMLLGALVVWGAGPRGVALAGTLAAVGAADRRAPLPVSESYRRRALERERRARAPEAPASRSEAGRGEGAAPAPAPDDRPLGAPAVLGYEIDVDGAWPPREIGGCTDLGLVDGAPDRRRVLSALDSSPTRPRALVAFFSRGETPAEAEREFLRSLVARGGERTAVALTLSRALATERHDRDAARIAQRTALWRDAATEAGVRPERIVEIDLHHLTEATSARLGELIDGRPAPGAPGVPDVRGIERALAEIDAWAERGDHAQASLAPLLLEIERGFNASPRWRSTIKAAASGNLGDAKAAVAESARALGRLLPAWAPRHPGWMAAAATLATAGTLGAVALAGGPIGMAAGAWPLYAALGAAIGELTGRGADAVGREGPRETDEAVAGARAAVLHALVLGLQGLPDERIATAIDATLRDAPEIAGARDVPRLTAHVRERLGAVTGPREDRA